MMRAAAVFVAILAVTSMAYADEKPEYTLGNGELASAFQDRISQTLSDFLASSQTEESTGRRLNAVHNGQLINGTKTFLSDAFKAIINAAQNTASNIHNIGQNIVYKYGNGTDHKILSNILGSSVWLNNQTLDALAHWGIDGTAYTKLMNEVASSNSFTQAYDIIEQAAISNGICKNATKIDSVKKPTECTGPKVVLELKPKECVIDPHAHQVNCTPAKLVLKKVPGECTFKHHSPFEWKGKECKIVKKFGKSDSGLHGGEPYTVYLKNPKHA